MSGKPDECWSSWTRWYAPDWASNSRNAQRFAAPPFDHVDAARYRDAMAGRDDKVTVEVDAEMIERARAELGLESESDTAVVERALNSYLLGRLLDSVQSRSDLCDEDADRIAYEELRAARRERGVA